MTDLPSNILGQTVKFKMQVMNRGGYYNVSYDALSVVIADVPSTPSNAPVSDADYTDPTRIRVTYDEPYSGGSVLTNF